MFNLAAALGGVTGALTWSHSWIYLLAGLLGGAGAAGRYSYLHPSPREVDRPPLSEVGQPLPESGHAGTVLQTARRLPRRWCCSAPTTDEDLRSVSDAHLFAGADTLALRGIRVSRRR